MPPNISSTANAIWAVPGLLRGDFKQSQDGRVILPFGEGKTESVFLAHLGDLYRVPGTAIN